MASPPPLAAKLLALRAYGAVHPHPEAVIDPLFATCDVLDAHDLVQTRYEMVRRVRIDRQPVSAVAAAFGVSRPTVYQTLATFEEAGLPGLLPRRRGPRQRHKLGPEVVTFITQVRVADGGAPVARLIEQVRERFGVTVHRRSIERAVAHPVKGGAAATT